MEVVRDEAIAPREFLRFDTLTLCPIEKRLVDPGLLSADERAWLDAYHARVLDTLGPDLDRADAGGGSNGRARPSTMPERRGHVTASASVVRGGPG